MGQYFPFNYQQINTGAGTYSPSPVKSYNNKTFAFWVRALFQRALSTLDITVPDNWEGEVKDFFLYCLYKFGYVSIFDHDEFGVSFQPCTLGGYDFYYQPTWAVIANPKYHAKLTIHEECEILKLTPDYYGVWDVIEYYAERLSLLDNALNMSLVNNKFAFILGAKNKSAAAALKKVMDLINRGEPAVVYDRRILDDAVSKDEPWQIWNRENLKQSYLTTDQLQDFQTILNNFDAEIGIPTLPNQFKRERLLKDEANSRRLDSMSRSTTWFETLSESMEIVNKHFGTNMTVEMRYLQPEEPLTEENVGDKDLALGGALNGNSEDDTNRVR